MLFLGLPLAFLVILGQTQAQSKCRSDELCVTVQRCNETDDSGRGIFGPRILDKKCGDGMVCCEKAQLDSYDATMAQILRNAQKTPELTFVSGYKSCGESKECVPRHLCNGTANDNGRYLIMPRIDQKSNFGCKSMEFCCPIEDHLNESNNPLSRNLRDFKYNSCGYSNRNGLYFDMEGYKDNEALFGQFPWMIALLDKQGNYVCGGTLIHPSLVLTSAHNILNHKADTLKARAGEWDLNSLEEPHAYQERTIRNLKLHEQFNRLTFYNDMALLVLEQPFVLEPHIQPLCLPPVETPQVQAQLRAAQCYATGWGHHNITSDIMQFILKRIDLPVLEHEKCQQLLRATILGRRYRLHPSVICAGGVQGKDTCKGDGGSPLFCTMPGSQDRYILAGIVSWGIECSEQDIPAAYTNVPYQRRWIDAQVAESGIKLEEP